MKTSEQGNQPSEMKNGEDLSESFKNYEAWEQKFQKETGNADVYLQEQIIRGFNQLTELIKAIPFQNPGDELSNWINSEEVIRIMKVSPRTMHTWRRNGTLKCSLIGNKLFYRKTDIEELLKAKFGTSTDQKRKD